MSKKITGTCQCGEITYELTEPPMYSVICYCKECQKTSGSTFSISMVVKTEALLLSGELGTWERQSDSGNTNKAHFCKVCGNRIYHSNPESPETIRLKPGTLDNTDIISPAAHIWTCEKQSWYKITDDLPQLEKQP